MHALPMESALPTDPPTLPFPTIYIIVLAAALAAGLVIFLVYLRSRSVPSKGPEYFEKLEKRFTNKVTGLEKFSKDSERLVKKATKKAKPLVDKAKKIQMQVDNEIRESRKIGKQLQQKRDEIFKVMERANNRERQQRRRRVRE